MADSTSYDQKEKELQALADKARQDGDLINRYISHEEVISVAYQDPDLLKHQFVETEDRGLVRNHSKSIRKTIGILGKMPRTEKEVSALEAVLDFLKNNKPTKGRKSNVIEVGTKKKVRLNKKQGYVLEPSVGDVFGMEQAEGEGWVNRHCIVEYISSEEIRITPYHPAEHSDGGFSLLDNPDQLEAFIEKHKD